jgi:hypothetical protein
MKRPDIISVGTLLVLGVGAAVGVAHYGRDLNSPMWTFLRSTSGKGLEDLGACAIWGVFAIIAWANKRVQMGNAWVVARADRPKLYWMLVAACLGIAVWAGIAGLSQLTT